MIKLLRNENMKIYSRFGTWVMISMLLLVIALGGILSKYDQPAPDVTKWRTQAEQNISQLKGNLQKEQDPLAIKQLEETIKINEYALAHNIVPIDYSAWSYTQKGINEIPFISLLVIVVAAGIVANEFTWGTVKSLLVKPYSRSKILLAKYLAVLQFAVVMLTILFVGTFLCKGILFGFTYIDTPYLSVDAYGNVLEGNMIVHLLSLYGLASVNLLFVATISFMISSLFRISSLAIGISFLLQLFGGVATSLLATKYNWIKYTLFANTQLSMYQEGKPLIEGMTLNFSLIVLLIYFVLFVATTWTVFNRRDIAG
ncbi:ABC transporter permease subunit [Brevibacillus ginsengisoli]|uniref:ABC transporter permease subunit n=1 Tax=Brevibacillus ginsengisoli TaxID=363854 RepID=UPI003CEB381E